jgi:hypothetical protein
VVPNNYRHIQYKEYRTKVKLFQITNEGFQRYVQQENTNYFIEDGVCDALSAAAHPAESTRTIRNNLQAVNPYTVVDLPAPTADEPPELSEAETDHIYRATNIIAASDSSVTPFLVKQRSTGA